MISQWIKCSERMPGENSEREVLACFKGGDISNLYYFDGRWGDAYGIVPIRQGASQKGIAQYSTKEKALIALRRKLEHSFASSLADIDMQISELKNQAA